MLCAAAFYTIQKTLNMPSVLTNAVIFFPFTGFWGQARQDFLHPFSDKCARKKKVLIRHIAKSTPSTVFSGPKTHSYIELFSAEDL